MDFNKVLEYLGWNELPPELLSSLVVFVIITIICLVIYFKAKSYNPLTKPKGIVHVAEICVEFADKQVESNMGAAFAGFGGFLVALGAYILMGFLFGMVGFPNIFQPGSDRYLSAMPNPFTNVAATLSLALVTFALIHITAMRAKKWAYFKRYIEPLPVFLPINLLTMWSPLLSLTLRLFGNALAGYFVVSLVYIGFSGLFEATMAGLAFTPAIAPFIHLYFDVFDGFIQMIVFCMLTMIYMSQEYISPEEMAAVKRDRENLKKRVVARRLERKHRRQVRNI